MLTKLGFKKKLFPDSLKAWKNLIKKKNAESIAALKKQKSDKAAQQFIKKWEFSGRPMPKA